MKSKDTCFLTAFMLGQLCDSLFLTLSSIWILSTSGAVLYSSLVISISSLARATALIPAGRICDTQNPKAVAIISSFVRICLLLPLALNPVDGLPSTWSLLVSSAVLGFVEALFMTSTQTIVVRNSHEQSLSNNQMRYSTTQRIASFVAAIMLGLLSTCSIKIALNSLTAMSVLAVALLTMIPRLRSGSSTQRGRTDGNNFKEIVVSILKNREAAVLLLFILVSEASSSSIQGTGFVALCAQKGWSDQALSYLLLAFSLGTILGSAKSQAIKRLLKCKLLLAASVLVVSFCAMPFVSSTLQASMLSFAAGTSCGAISTNLITNYLCATNDIEQPGTAASILNFSAFGTAAVSSVAFGYTSDSLGLSLAFTLFSLPIELVALALTAKRPSPNHRE